LIAEKVIHRDLESETEILLGHRYRSALHSGELEAIRAMKPFGLLPFLRNFMDMVMREHHYSPFGPPMFNGVVQQLHIARNSGLTCLKYMEKHVVNRPTAEVGMMLFLGVIAKRVIEDETLYVKDFFSMIDKPHWETKAFLRTEIHSENWPPMQQGYFEIVGQYNMDSNLEIGLTEEGIQALLPELSRDVLESLLESNQITVPHKSPEKILSQQLLFVVKSIDPTKNQSAVAARTKGCMRAFVWVSGDGEDAVLFADGQGARHARDGGECGADTEQMGGGFREKCT
jgi:hypothetical protein